VKGDGCGQICGIVPAFFLQRLVKSMEIVSHDNRFAHQDFNPGPSEKIKRTY
jgi:hypothetical protein